MDYRKIYNLDLFRRADGIQSLLTGKIKFGDALAAIAYAHDITYDELCAQFPEVARSNRYEGPKYNVYDQVKFIENNKRRHPGKILEIGAGRGEVTNFLAYQDYDITAIEVSNVAPSMFVATATMLFENPEKLVNAKLINEPLSIEHDFSQYDTIMMVESLEHILAEDFDPVWEKIKETFNGYFVVTNWLEYHPIAVGQYAPPDKHCRLVDDDLYDYFARSGRTVYRNRSHLCIEVGSR